MSQISRRLATKTGIESEGEEPIRIAAVGDLHARLDHSGRLRRFFRAVNEEADLLLLAGDLTHRGLPEEAQQIVEELSVVKVPKIAVLGNHDFEQGRAGEVTNVLTRGKIHVLDGDSFVYKRRVGIVGVKGFCGGFDKATLEPWGEQIIKQFVLEAINESLKLETALARIQSIPLRIALTHYAPIKGTANGEHPEIMPFLGCSRLVEPMEKFGITLAVHGHCHKGQGEARTPRGQPVHNVTMEVLWKEKKRHFQVFEV